MPRTRLRQRAVFALGVTSIALAGIVCSGAGASADELARLGRQALWNRSPEGVALFQQALRAEPSSPFRWADLAEAYMEAGDTKKARRCLLQAVRWGPEIPQIGLRAMRFHLAFGDEPGALAAAATVLRSTRQFDSAVFPALFHSGMDSRRVLEAAIGTGPDTGAGWLQFLISEKAEHRQVDEAWEHVSRQGASPELAKAYAKYLFATGRHTEAAAHWRRASPISGANLILNGGFELSLSAGPFEWELAESSAFTTSVDTRKAFEGTNALRLRFKGNENIELREVGQRVLLPAGRYLLRAMIRTEDLTSDEGVGFRIVDDHTRELVAATAARMTGTNEWTEVTAEFVIRGAERMVRVEVARERSRRVTGEIDGTAWVDAVRLERTS